MSVTYDWSPVTNAIQGLGQQYMYRKMLGTMFGQPPEQAPQANTGFPGQDARMDAAAPPPALRPGTLGSDPNMAKMLPMLQMAGPQVGLPLLLKMMTQQNEYDTTPHYDQNGNAYLVGKDGSTKKLDGVQQQHKVEFVNGQAVDPYSTTAGTVIPQQIKPNPNQPFNSDGTANKAYQDWEVKLARARAQATADFRAPKATAAAPITIIHPSAGY